jgi:hypothetical protein
MPKKSNNPNNKVTNFDKNIYINCPFDKKYEPMLKALLFTVIDCGYEPRIASESFDSAQSRMSRIKGLVQQSRYSIHDLSRMEPLKENDLPRFNMPFELGLDFGCRYYGPGRLEEKTFLVLEKEKYRFQRVISDLAGFDIGSHNSDAETLVRRVRNWILVLKTTKNRLRSPAKIWQRFNEFLSHFEIATKELGFSKKDIEEMPVAEFMGFIKDWIRLLP